MKITEENSIRCDSIVNYLDIILNSKIEQERKGTHLYYRGESKYHKFIVPNLYLDRKLTGKTSEYYYRSLFSQLGRDEYMDSSSLFRQMSEFQHYGAKTSILDISSNPLIALYFATEKHHEESGFVYIYFSDIYHERFDTSNTVAIKTALSFIPEEKIVLYLMACRKIQKECNTAQWRHLTETSMAFLEDVFSSGLGKYELLSRNEYKWNILPFMTALNQKARTHEELIYPFAIFETISGSHIIIPSECTDRIKQQQGCFLFPKYVNSYKTEDKEYKDYSETRKTPEEIRAEIDDSVSSLLAKITTPQKTVSVIEIPGSQKKSIQDQLTRLGITEGFIYPEIEHRSNAILNSL